MKEKIEKVFFEHNIQAKVHSTISSCKVLRFNIVLGSDVRLSDIHNVSEFLTRALRLSQEPIIAENYSKGFVTIDIEKDKANQQILYVNDLEIDTNKKLPLLLGRDIDNKTITEDLAELPHLLVSGCTGSGKSVALKTFIYSLFQANDKVKFVLIDPKRVEFPIFERFQDRLMQQSSDGLPIYPIYEPEGALNLLNSLYIVMNKRFCFFAKKSIRDFEEYLHSSIEFQLSRIVIVIDEFADLIMYNRKFGNKFMESLCKLAQKCRAAGMYIIAATQRPSREVVTGVIKANFPARMAFQVSSKINSAIVFDKHGFGAERLLGKGDALFYKVGYKKPIRIQSPYTKNVDFNIFERSVG